MSYRFEWIFGPALIGALLVLLLVPPFALIALALVALFAVAGLAGALLGVPYLLVRSVRRRHGERHRSTKVVNPSPSDFDLIFKRDPYAAALDREDAVDRPPARLHAS